MGKLLAVHRPVKSSLHKGGLPPKKIQLAGKPQPMQMWQVLQEPATVRISSQAFEAEGSGLIVIIVMSLLALCVLASKGLQAFKTALDFAWKVLRSRR